MWTDNDWSALQQHAARCSAKTIQEIIASEAGRAQEFSKIIGPLYFNFSRQHFDCETIEDLLSRLEKSGLF